jgi:hypothetical protein
MCKWEAHVPLTQSLNKLFLPFTSHPIAFCLFLEMIAIIFIDHVKIGYVDLYVS